jgi:hypothetical protein
MCRGLDGSISSNDILGNRYHVRAAIAAEPKMQSPQGTWYGNDDLSAG